MQNVQVAPFCKIKVESNVHTCPSRYSRSHDEGHLTQIRCNNLDGIISEKWQTIQSHKTLL